LPLNVARAKGKKHAFAFAVSSASAVSLSINFSPRVQPDKNDFYGLFTAEKTKPYPNNKKKNRAVNLNDSFAARTVCLLLEMKNLNHQGHIEYTDTDFNYVGD
jgi:hypothetical protein